MFYHNINPVLASFGPFEIRYYGLFYAAGFLIAYFMVKHLAKKRALSLEDNDVSDLMIIELVSVVALSRIFYILFYNPLYYFKNPLEMVAVWHGGLSFHGGLAGAIIGIIFFCRKKKIEFYEIADIIVFPVALALALGRIGNFINAELVGRLSDVSWCVDYSKNVFLSSLPEGCRHPSQIYESIKNLAIFGILWKLKDKKLGKGVMFWSFVALYGLFRTVVEFFRLPDEQVGFIFNYLTMGQILSIPLFVIGTYMAYFIYRRNKSKR